MLLNKNYKNYNLNILLYIIGLSLAILFLVSINSSVQAENRVVNFQGRLTDQQGNPLDGTYDIKFSIYESDPNMGPLWTESHTDVSVSKGLVNVLLGSITSFDEPQNLTFDQERYLGITIDCDNDPNTKEEEMSPRQRILPAIYSYNADRLDGKDSSEYTTPQTDAGRPGVTEHIYEGNTRLVDKYARKEELDWNQLKNIPSGFSDGTDHVNDAVSNPSGTYNSMKVGYATSAGNANSASNASQINGVQFGPSLRYCVAGNFQGSLGDVVVFIWPNNWSSAACKTKACVSGTESWYLWDCNSSGNCSLIAGGNYQCR